MNNTNREIINTEVQTEEMQRQAIMRLLNKQTEKSTMLLCRVSIAESGEVSYQVAGEVFDEVPNAKAVYEFRGARYCGEGTMQERIGIVIKAPDGRMSEVIKIPKTRLLNSNKALDFLCNYSFGFGKAEIETLCVNVADAVVDNLNKMPCIAVKGEWSLYDICNELLEYVISHERERDKDTKKVGFKAGFINEDGKEVCGTDNGKKYCYIRTDCFKDLISELECGYSAVAIKKKLDEKKMLLTNSNRYDYARSDADHNYDQYRVIAFLCTEGGEI